MNVPAPGQTGSQQSIETTQISYVTDIALLLISNISSDQESQN